MAACAAHESVNITLSRTFQMGNYTHAIDISAKQVCIFGNNAKLDAGHKGRFFNADGSKGPTSLKLYDLTLQNGNVREPKGRMSEAGGAIFAAGPGVKLEIHSTSFISNQANGGGAICAYHGPDVKIFSSEFKGNSADFGGAVASQYGATLEVDGSEFNNNSAVHGDGGAIYTYDAGVNIHSSIFEMNIALIGGALHASGAEKQFPVHVQIRNSSFIANKESSIKTCGWCSATAPVCSSDSDCSPIGGVPQTCNACNSGAGIYGGGAIFIQGSLLGVNSTFEGNNANLQSPTWSPSAGGGAVYLWSGAVAKFAGCVFNGNNNTKGRNDITRHDSSSNVTFPCPDGTTGTAVIMKALEMADPTPTKCVPVWSIN